MRLNFKNQKNIFNIHEGSVPYLSFRALDDAGIFINGFTTKDGGVSEGYLASLNLTLKKEGEKREHVLENFRRLSEAAGFDMDKAVLSDQTHTTNVRRVKAEDAGKGLLTKPDYESVDGLVTDVPDITLVTFYADCVPLYIADPRKKAIGLSHSGWRGTVGRMGEITLKRMEELYGTDSQDVICCVGPSICRDCFEVGPEVAEAFLREFGPGHREEILAPGAEPGKYQLDLWKANEIVLTEAGVRPDHLHVTDICTCCNPSYLFSHRKMGERRGNLCAFLALREPAGEEGNPQRSAEK